MREHVTSGTGFEAEYGYSRAVRIGDIICVAGTGPAPADGESLAGSAHDQMLRCGEIVLAALAEFGAGAADVVRTRMFITDIADADEVGTAHRLLFGAAAPAATMVVISELAIPEWKVELEVDAIRS